MQLDYLYHYTSIDTLALILENKKMKLNNLLDVNDRDEGARCNKSWGKYCFISCWTDYSEESIPMWHMYSRDMKGVRIKLQKNPFIFYERECDISDDDGKSIGRKKIEFVLPNNDIVTEKYTLVTPSTEDFLHQVKYVSDDEISNIKDTDIKKALSRNTMTATTTHLGKYKSTYWDFEKEWRYILVFWPNRPDIHKQDLDKYPQASFEALNVLCDLPFKDYYLNIRDDAFSNMEITLGPKVGEIEKRGIQSVVKEFNPAAIVKDSILSGRIR